VRRGTRRANPVDAHDEGVSGSEVQLMLAMPVPFAESGTVAVGLKGWQVRPEGTVSPRATEPTKLNVLVRVIEEEIDVLVAPLGDVALIEKSPT